MHRFFRFCLFVFALPFLLQCTVDEETVVGEVGGHTVTLSQYKQQLKDDFPGMAYSDISMAEKVESLENMLDKRRKYLWAIEEGLNKEESYQRQLESQTNRVMSTELYQKLITDVLIPEDVLRQYYEWYNIDLKLLVLRVGYRGAEFIHSKRPYDEALVLAEDYRSRLVKTPNPEKVVLFYTEDRRRDYLMDPYSISSFPQEVEEILFNLKVDEVSPPLKTDQGILIFRLVGRQEKPIERNFENTRREISSLLRSRIREEESEMFDKLSRQFMAKYGVEYFDAELDQFAAILQTWGKAQNPSLSDFTEKERSMVFARINNEDYLSANFIDIMGAKLLIDYRRYPDGKTIRQGFVETQVNLKSWALEAEAEKIEQTEFVKQKLLNFEIEQLSKKFDEVQIHEKFDISEEDVLAFYEESTDLYQETDKIEIQQIGLKTQEEAEKILARARAGEDFKRLYDQYSIEFQGRGKGRFDLGAQDRASRYKVVVEAAFEAGANQIIGPVKVGKSFYVVKTGNYIPPARKPFKDVRHIARGDLLNKLQQEKRDEIIKNIREKYEYSIDESLLQELG